MTATGRAARKTGAKATAGAAGWITVHGLLSVLLLPLVIVAFTLIVVWIGLPLLALALRLLRALSMQERKLAGRMRGLSVASPYRPAAGGSWLENLRTVLSDSATYRDLLQLLVSASLGLALGIVSLVFFLVLP